MDKDKLKEIRKAMPVNIRVQAITGAITNVLVSLFVWAFFVGCTVATIVWGSAFISWGIQTLFGIIGIK